MTRTTKSTPTAVNVPVAAFTIAAVVGLGFAVASTWVHYRILNDPLPARRFEWRIDAR
jgi:hypothetical protein